jgi:bacillolysin
MTMKKIYAIAAFVCALTVSMQAQGVQNPFSQTKGQERTTTNTHRRGSAPVLENLNRIKAKAAPQSTKTVQGVVPRSVKFEYDKLNVQRDRDSQLPIFIEGRQKGVSSQRGADIQEKAKAYLAGIKNLIAVQQPDAEFSVEKIEKDALGQQHIRLQQMYGGLPVYGGEVMLHEKDGAIQAFNGRNYPTPKLATLRPALGQAQAQQVAITDVSQKTTYVEMGAKEKAMLHYDGPSAELVIFHVDENPKAPRLTWHITVRPNFMQRWEYFIDAQTGKVLNHFDHTCSLVPHIEDRCTSGPTTANATDLNGQNQLIHTYLDGSTYYLFDASRTNMYNGNINDPEGAIFTLDMQETNLNNPKYADIYSSNNTWSDRTAVSAHFNAGKAFEYYLNTHSRKSINGQGGNIISFIHVRDDDGTKMDNAFWNGQYIFYGDGNQAFKPLAGALDVAGHELTHGVVSNTANLNYQGESGAINESMADVFGAMIDRDDWRMGEDVVFTSVFPSGALRSLQDPHNGGSSLQDNGWQPKHVSEKYTGTGDNGGVHINSGIPNHAFYRFATSSGMTKEKAEKIYYRALSSYLTRSSKFIDLRLAVIKAATDLYGTTEINAAKSAFDAVGITDGTSTPPPAPVEVNPGQDYILSYDTNTNDPNTLYRSSTSGSNFLALTTKEMRHKPSVADDGSYAIFVASDKTLWGIELEDTDNNGTLDLFNLSNEAVWENAAISKDGNRMAATFSDNDNRIWIYDFEGEGWKDFTLYNPTTATGNTETNEVQYADALEWDFSGEYLMYDAYNVQPSANGSEQIDYWDVGFLHAWNNASNTLGDGRVSKLFSSLPANSSIGNPSFSKNSPNIIAFDYFYTENSTPKYEVLAVDIEANKIISVVQNTTLGYPNYSKLDDKIIFNYTDNTNGSQIIAVIPMASDKLTPSGNATGLIADAIWGIWYSTGDRDLSTPTHDIPELDGGLHIMPNPFSDKLTLEATATETAKGRIAVFDLLGRNVYQQNVSIGIGANRWELPLDKLPSGHYMLQLEVNGGIAVQKAVKL